jgi:transcriptional regulator with XRE-family HTH domain
MVNRTGPEKTFLEGELLYEMWLLSLIAARARNRAPIGWLATRFGRGLPSIETMKGLKRGAALARPRKPVEPVRPHRERWDAALDAQIAMKADPRAAVLEIAARLQAAGAVQATLSDGAITHLGLAHKAGERFLFRKVIVNLMAEMRWGGHTVERLARHANVSQSTMSRWIAGKFAASHDEIVRLAGLLGMDRPALAREMGSYFLMALNAHETFLAHADLTPGELKRARAFLAKMLEPQVGFMEALAAAKGNQE